MGRAQDARPLARHVAAWGFALDSGRAEGIPKVAGGVFNGLPGFGEHVVHAEESVNYARIAYQVARDARLDQFVSECLSLIAQGIEFGGDNGGRRKIGKIRTA